MASRSIALTIGSFAPPPPIFSNEAFSFRYMMCVGKCFQQICLFGKIITIFKMCHENDAWFLHASSKFCNNDRSTMVKLATISVFYFFKSSVYSHILAHIKNNTKIAFGAEIWVKLALCFQSNQIYWITFYWNYQSTWSSLKNAGGVINCSSYRFWQSCQDSDLILNTIEFRVSLIKIKQGDTDCSNQKICGELSGEWFDKFQWTA